MEFLRQSRFDDEPRLTLNNKALGRDDDGRPTDWDQWADLVLPVRDGDLAGFRVTVSLRIVEGRVCTQGIQFDPPNGLAALEAGTSRALRSVKVADVSSVLDACLRNMALQYDDALEWLDALGATRKRPGRAGLAPQQWARIAQRRVAAEEADPGNAVRYMRQTWPDEFSSDQAVWAKVNKAKARGMLAFTDDGPHLTDLAQRILGGDQ